MAEKVAALWRAAEFKAEAVNDIALILWEKLICNVAYSAPCAIAG
jgi:2-dehydropantoate 2-reductase